MAVWLKAILRAMFVSLKAQFLHAGLVVESLAEPVGPVFFLCLSPAPPVHPAVIRYLTFAGVQIQGLFS